MPMKWTRHDEVSALYALEAADSMLVEIAESYPGDDAGKSVRENAAKILDLIGFIHTALSEHWASESPEDL